MKLQLKNRLVMTSLAATLTGSLSLVFAPSALADPYTPIPYPYADPTRNEIIPPPYGVPGKEYSNELDTSSTPAGVVLDDQQNTMWNGIGGIADTFDYNGGNGTSGNPNDQVDAIANVEDLLFHEAVNNEAAILFSTRVGDNRQGDGYDAGAPARGCAAGDPVCYESVTGLIGTWATWQQVDQNYSGPNGLLRNLDGLEVWGAEQIDDANRFSLFGDTHDCSIWAGTGPGSTCYATNADIDSLFGLHVDIDGLMVFDEAGSLDTFDVGDWLMFSLWPSTARADLTVGDAVYVYQKGNGMDYLFHGGHDWDNNWLGLNVDALEAVRAVPEPDSLALMVAGLAGFAATRRRKKA